MQYFLLNYRLSGNQKFNTMKKSIVLGLAVLAFFSCKKEEDPTLVECAPEITVQDYMPMAIGNYWVYEHVKIDSAGNESKLGLIDSIRITRKETLRGNEYYVFEGTRQPIINNKGIVHKLRDSLGYLVNSGGNALMSVVNFTDTIFKYRDPSDSNWITKSHGIMETERTVVIEGIGPVRVINSAGYFEHNKNRFPQSQRLKVKINNHYTKGVGLILDTYFWSSDFLNSGNIIERRLVKYHIEKE